MNVEQKYRDPSFTPQQLAAIYIGGTITQDVAAICLSADYKLNEGERYQAWLQTWKTAYVTLSEIIRNAKATGKNGPDEGAARAKSLVTLRYLANSMLNARQFARDRRRAVLDEAFGRS